MRLLPVLLACLLGAMNLLAPIVAAQDDVDIPAIAETVLARDPEALVQALRIPMTNEHLPAPFSGAEYVDPESVPGDAASIAGDEMGDVVGNVMYSVAYKPDENASASPSPVASPIAGGPASIYTTASLNYLVYDHALNPETLESFDQVVIDALGDQAADAEVKQISIGETTAYLITITTMTNGIELVMQWNAIPVGNVAVVSMAMSGGVAVESDELRTHAQALALAGARHLGAVAEDESQPAG